MTDTITLTLDLNEAEILYSLLDMDKRFGDAADIGVLDEVKAIMAKIDFAIGDALGLLDDEDE